MILVGPWRATLSEGIYINYFYPKIALPSVKLSFPFQVSLFHIPNVVPVFAWWGWRNGPCQPWACLRAAAARWWRLPRPRASECEAEQRREQAWFVARHQAPPLEAALRRHPPPRLPVPHGMRVRPVQGLDYGGMRPDPWHSTVQGFFAVAGARNNPSRKPIKTQEKKSLEKWH